jgi:cell division protein FtsL
MKAHVKDIGRRAAGEVARQVGAGLKKRARDVRAKAEELGPLLPSVLLVVPVVIAALFSVWVEIDGLRLGYEMAEVQRQHEALKSDERALRTELQNLKNHDRLQAIGAERFGLQMPKPEQRILRLDELASSARGAGRGAE